MAALAGHEAVSYDLMPIALGTLRASSLLAFDLYLPSERSPQPVLYRQRSHPFAQADLDRLMERGVRTLYIASADAEPYREHLREKILKNEDIPPVARYQALREATRVVLSEALAHGNADNAVTVTEELSGEMVRTVCESKLIINELLKTMSHDYGSFNHAMNVATYCLLLAQNGAYPRRRNCWRSAKGRCCTTSACSTSRGTSSTSGASSRRGSGKSCDSTRRTASASCATATTFPTAN